MVRPRARRGERRIDAAIDHLAVYGFPRIQIRRIVNDLLSVYGRNGWMFLEEEQYRVVLDRLLEEQAQPQQDQQQAAAAAAVSNVALPENDGQVSPKNHMQVSPENHMQVSPENHMEVSGVHNEAPIDQSQSALEQQAFHNGSASLEPVLPLCPAAQAAPAKPVRPPCYGWISEESESETELEDGKVLPNMPCPSESLPSRKKRPSRWDVGPSS